ncbi:MAG: arsenite methyltransferase [Methanoregula sp.]|nr:arsenite methyltransferase [Methanoregula sp.]
MKKKEPQDIREMVREGYAKVAKGGCGCCGPSPCCGGADAAEQISKKVGYSSDEMGAVPDGANLGLGCGNPLAHAAIHEGDTILDLGSGAGFDCFLAARRVGKTGRVIGVDMTPEMIARARENAKNAGVKNVEFRLGEIESLPVADSTVDLVISNCVINLSPDKARVFSEAFRVLKEARVFSEAFRVLKDGGTLMVSDIVLERDLPESVLSSVAAYVGCLAGAVQKSVYLDLIRGAGFSTVEVLEEASYPIELMVNDPTAQAVLASLSFSRDELHTIGESVHSVKVRAVKPHS